MSTRRANSLNGSDWLKNSFSIWRGLGRDTDVADHPAPFPVALAARLIACYASDADGVVLDPFAGSGSTLIAALRAGMKTVGLDINPRYRDIFVDRLSLAETPNAHLWRYDLRDARTLGEVVQPESVEICITSPPYWDILNRRRSADGKQARPYSRNGCDIGNLSTYDDFLDALAQTSCQIGAALRARGYFILNVMDIRKGSVFYPLHQDAAHAIDKERTFQLDDIIVWDRQAEYNSMRPLGYPYKFIVNKVHEYLLVFRKLEDRHG